MKRLFLLSALATFLVSCAANNPQTRIEKNPTRFDSLSGRHQSLASQGRIEEGMSKDAVFIAWGAPSSTGEGQEEGRTFERWNYLGHRPVYHRSFYGGFGYGRGFGRGFGGGCGRFGHGRFGRHGGFSSFGTQVSFVPYRAAFVDFENDRVKSWQRGR